MIGVTADTNIYISALNFGGVPRQFLIAAQHKRFQLDISAPILTEMQRILRDKFAWTDRLLRLETFRLSQITTLTQATQTINAVAADPDDNKIIECAVAAGSRYIVTGDNDLLRLGQYQGIRIVRVADFMALINP